MNNPPEEEATPPMPESMVHKEFMVYNKGKNIKLNNGNQNKEKLTYPRKKVFQ